MKKALLSLVLFFAVFIGHSQVILNELYGEPNSGNIANVGQQYFELYNTGTTAVSLDCYAIVAYNASGQGSFNVIDFPSNAVIQPKSYYVAAVGPGPYTYGTRTLTSANINLNWNMGITPLRVAGGSFKRYTRRTTAPIGYDTTSITGTNFFAYAPSNNRYSIFLFRYNPDNPGVATYVNGFVAQDGAAINQPGATLNISSFPDLTIEANAGNTCKYTIKWADVKFAEFRNEATGNDHGYYRTGNGKCGTWVKATNDNQFTPGTPNPNPITSTNTTTSGALITTETLTCGSSQVTFSISETSTNVQFPIEVELYYDDNNNNDIDANEFQGSITNITSLPYTGAFNILPGKNVVLVYQTALGCISKIVKPTASTGDITTKELNICGNKIDFSVLTATGNAATYGFPMSVQLYENNGAATFDPTIDVPIGTAVSISSASSTTYSIPIPEASKGKLFILVYTSRLNCLSKAVIPQFAAGTINTEEVSVCGNQIDFRVTGATGDAISSYVFPITVNLYQDKNGNQTLDDDEKAIIGTTQVTEFSPTKTYTLPNPSPNLRTLIQYNAAQPCFTTVPPRAPRPTSGSLTTSQSYFCGKRVNFTIPQPSSTDVDVTRYSLPVVVSVYHDANSNGLLDDDERVPARLLGRTTVNSFSNVEQSINLAQADWSKAVIVEYQTAATCFTKVIKPTITTTGELTVGGAIATNTSGPTPVSTLTYFVVQGSTDADAYPLEIKVYEDANNNKVIDAAENTPIATRSLAAPPPTGTTYDITLNNFKSNAIVVSGSTIGCSQDLLVVENSNAALPVKLVSFNAKRNKEKVALTWQTAMEVNNSGFDIQRKLANGEWKTIAFMFSKATDGNSNSMLSYEYTDINSTKGVTQYRLRQVDIDTRSTFSEVRSVHGLEQASRLLVYPNPSADGKVNVVFDDQQGSRNIIVSDFAGRVVQQYRNITDNSLQIDNLQNGIYTLKIINNSTGETAVEKIIIKKR